MKYTDEQVAAGLAERDPKRLNKVVHTAVLRVSPGIAIEAVALRNSPRGVEVLLRQRTMDEPSYPGEWHCPGSFVRDGETEVEVLARLTAGESLGHVTGSRLITNIYTREERGWYCGAVYLVDVEDASSGAHWFPVNDLPDPTIDHHRHLIIPAALKYFTTSNR